MKTPFESILLVFAASVIGSIAAVLLKAGANQLRSGWRDWIGRIGAGVGLFLISSVFYVKGLQNGSLTVLYPMVSLGYVWTLIWSRIFFGKLFNRHKVVGLGLVVLGVFFISLGNQ